jgi:hypothetical protein
VERTVTVGKGTQVITFQQPAGAVVGGADVDLSASVPAGLFVGFTSQTPAVCTVAAGRIHPVTGGTCTIAANQSGNASYLPATEVTRTVTVAKAAQTINFTQPADGTYGGPDVPLAATATSGLTAVLTSLTPSTCSVVAGKAHPLEVGACTIAADQRVTRSFNVAKAGLQVTTASSKLWLGLLRSGHAYLSEVRSAVTGQPVAGVQVTTTVDGLSAAYGCTATTNALGVASCQSTQYVVPRGRTYLATVTPSASYLGASITAPLL